MSRDDLARDLDARRVTAVRRSACGRFVARFDGPAYPPRQRVRRRWIAAAGLRYDVAGAALAGAGAPVGAVIVIGPSGERRIACRAAPLVWSPSEPVLAGLTAGPGRTRVWRYRADTGELDVERGVVVSGSLLGVHGGGPAAPLLWTPAAELVVLAAAGPEVPDRDEVRDTADPPAVADAANLLAAAAVTVHRVGTPSATLAGPFVVCRFEVTAGGEVVLGQVRDPVDLGRLIGFGAAPTLVVDPARPGSHRERGVEVVRAITPSVPRPVPSPPQRGRRLSADVVLHEATDGGPVVLWISPQLGPDRDAPDHAEAGAEVPPGPLWTYRRRASVALVRLWHAPQGAGTSFAALRDGVVDRLRAAIGLVRETCGAAPLVLAGHSFGAALAAVALPQLGDELSCAILRSGAYNRTLTPTGFQNERRPLWDAPDAYAGFTVVGAARRITVPTLLLQGTADPNGSTTTVQARNLFDALEAAGVPARMVLLEGEGHVFGTAEGVLRAAQEELGWIDRWCRRPSVGGAVRGEVRDENDDVHAARRPSCPT